MIERIIVILFACAGLLISLYFTLVYKKLMAPDTHWVPKFCRIERNSCESILNYPDARIFKVPNFYLGIVFYILLIIVVLNNDLFAALYLNILTWSGFTVAIGIYLTYSLLFKIRIRCVLCITSHVINLALFILIAAAR